MLKILNHGEIAELRLERPPVNAFNPELVAALDETITQTAAECRALILSGREGLFSAGLDVPQLLQLDREGMAEFWRRFFGLLETLARCPVPCVAALTGHAPAGGAVLSLYCDYRIMSAGDYRIGLNETQVGLLVPRVIQRALIRLTGPHRAERLIVAGSLLSPQQALEAGLVDELADTAAATIEAAVTWCEGLLALPQHAMLGNRALLRAPLWESFDQLGEQDVEQFVSGWFDPQAQRALHSLVAQLSKR